MEETEFLRARRGTSVKGPDFTDPARKSHLEVVLELPRRGVPRRVAAALGRGPLRRIAFRKARLGLLPPTKAVFEALARVAETVDAAMAGEADEGGMAECFGACEMLLSRNRERVPVTAADLELSGFGMDDASDLLGWYFVFVDGLAQGKN